MPDQPKTLHDRLTQARQRCVETPLDADAWARLGALLGQAGQPGLAEQALRRSLQLRPGSAAVRRNIALALQQQQRAAEAVQVLEALLGDHPHDGATLAMLGSLYLLRGDAAQAAAILGQAAKSGPLSAEAAANFATALFFTGALEPSAALLVRLLRELPGAAALHDLLATVRCAQGEPAQALVHHERALSLDPHDARAQSNRLLSALYAVEIEPARVRQWHRDWGARYAVRPRPPRRTATDPLRVGYVSADLREHSVGYFLPAVLAPQSGIETWCYASQGHADAVTAQIKASSTHWRDIAALSDAQAAALIRQDGIDLLIDLGGHTAGSRLGVFALRPAPVQASYLGYPHATGLAAIDFRIADAWSDPPENSPSAAERLARMAGGFLCYTPPVALPPLPVRARVHAGAVRFGCFNHLPKLNAPWLALWGELLRALPTATLLLKTRAFADAATRERWRRRHAALLPLERVTLRGPTATVAEHLATYGEIDIALDTHPYNGTTTTCEALCMGTPVIAMAGERHAARVGVSLLRSAGLPELIADTPQDYVQRAVALATAPERLAIYHRDLRTRVLASPLCDAEDFGLRHAGLLRALAADSSLPP